VTASPLLGNLLSYDELLFPAVPRFLRPLYPMSVSKIPRIAVLMNSYPSVRSSAERDSLISAIRAASPAAQINFYDPIEEQLYPEPAEYDLLVLSGGTEDPSGEKPWVRMMQAFLRGMVKRHPTKKILGICWGHQTLCVTFGGAVGGMPEAEV
jgi:glucosinolate gamma-glutamyl hydrolase